MSEEKEKQKESFRAMFKGFFAIFKHNWLYVLDDFILITGATFFGLFFYPLLTHGNNLNGGFSLGMFLVFALLSLIVNHMLVSSAFSKDPDGNEIGSRVLLLLFLALCVCIVLSIALAIIGTKAEYAPYLKPGFVGGCSVIAFYCLIALDAIFDQKIFRKAK